jgi:coniferyl-aldehyde dehydrogenase
MVANIAEFAQSNTEIEYLKKVHKLQQDAYRKAPYPSYSVRKANLAKLNSVLKKYQRALVEAMNEDFGGRGIVESTMADVVMAQNACHHNSKNLAKWMKSSKRSPGIMNVPGSAEVMYQPLGVIGVISPWNYPVQLAAIPLAGALAAGNRSVIKMSEFTPKTGQVFKEAIASVFGEDEVAVILGEVDVAVEFSKQPWDHLVFTGATSIAHHVMRAAAEHLTPLTLELGGKSPTILDPAVNMQDACEKIAFGKGMNAGQTCIAPDYVLCPESRVEEFVKTFTKTVAGMYPTIKDNKYYTSVVNERQHSRLQGVLKDAEEKGAEIIAVNPANEDLSDCRKMPLHIVVNGTDDMKVMQDEIFGPILPVVAYKTIDDAIDYINDRPRPLALYYFGQNKATETKVLQHTHSGGVSINETVIHASVENLPFGGIGPSGMGHYHGEEGFKTFSKAKGIYRKGKLNLAKFVAYPPYDKGFKKKAMEFLSK